jgi:hypothetical protein
MSPPKKAHRKRASLLLVQVSATTASSAPSQGAIALESQEPIRGDAIGPTQAYPAKVNTI